MHNLPFKLDTETHADGNCFYNALLPIIKRYPDLLKSAHSRLNRVKDDLQSDTSDFEKMNMQQLKIWIIEYLKQDLKNVICDYYSCPNFCGSSFEHLMYLSEDNSWADEFVIKAATGLFNIRICLVEPNGETNYYTWEDKWQRDVYMFYFPKLHFQALLTLKEYTDNSKKTNNTTANNTLPKIWWAVKDIIDDVECTNALAELENIEKDIGEQVDIAKTYKSSDMKSGDTKTTHG